MGSQQKVEASLRNVERSGVMLLDDIDFKMRDRGAVAARLAGCLQYFARVENEVDPEGLQVLMPLLGTEYEGYRSYGQEFLDLWVPQELAHGQILDELQRQLGIEPLEPKHEISPHNVRLGQLGEKHPGLHQAVELTYYAQGATQEALALTAYNRCFQILVEMGEATLAKQIFFPMRMQEGLHRSFYRNGAKNLREHVTKGQALFSKAVMSLTFSPVGAGEDKDKPQLGYIVEELGGEVDTFAQPAFAEAQALLGVNPRWIRRAFNKCDEAHRNHPYEPPFIESQAA